MLLGDLEESPAVLPADVEAFFFSAYRPSQGASGKPGHFVPVEVPEEVLQRVLAAYDREPARAGDATKIRAELAARVAYAFDPDAYHPWVADELCAPCVEFRAMPWQWRGVQAVQEPGILPHRYRLTCGMLRDVGLVSDQAGCEREQKAVLDTYVQYLKDKADEERKGARDQFMRGIIVSAIMTVATLGVGAALGFTLAGAVAVTSMSLLTAFVQNPEGFVGQDPGQWLKTIGGALLNLVPVIGGAAGQVIKMTVETAEAANEFREYLATRGDVNDALNARADQINGMLLQLGQLIQSRASFEEIAAANRAAQEALDEALAEKRARDRAWLIGGAVAAVGVLALSGGRRR